MLAAYLDETGLHGGSPFVAVCGLVGTTLEWSRLEHPWAENLQTTRVSVFHGFDCENGDGEFFGKSLGIRESLVTGLSTDLAKRELDVGVCGVVQKEWDQCASTETKQRFQTPYHFCLEFIFQKLNSWSRINANGEPIAMVFAEHQQYAARTMEIYEHYVYSNQFPHLGLLSFGKPKCLIQLQAADLLAHETYKYMRQRFVEGTEKISPALMKMLGMMSDPYNAGMYDHENIANLAPSGGVLEMPPR
jgi:hypothetical protein